MMKKTPPAANPDAYVGSLRGWRRELVELLRSAVTSAGEFDEVIKWGTFAPAPFASSFARIDVSWLHE